MNLLEITVRYLRKRVGRETPTFCLDSEFRRYGLSSGEAKEGIRQMMNHGVLYSPREIFVRLVPRYE